MATRPSEFALIAELFAPLATHRGAFGLKDDAALVSQKAGHDVVVTTDAIVEGVHFLATDPPETVAKKALRVNLSDLAAKGAKATGYLLVLGLPVATDMKWLRGFAFGLRSDQTQFAITLLGGDTTATSGPLTIAVTAFGHVPKGKMLRRSGARVGDVVFVTGTIGDAAAGLAVAKGEGKGISGVARNHLLQRFRVPHPRTAFGLLLRSFASAALDISDGLVADLGHISETSKVRIVINAASVPRSVALHALWGDGAEALRKAITGGDDYEIAFTAPAGAERKIMRASAKTGVPVTKIGQVERGRGVTVHDAAGKPLNVGAPGWTHF